MTRRATCWILSAAAVAAWAPGTALGSDVDAFENKVKPVSQAYQKAGKLELTPTGAVSLNDAFFTKYMGGLKVGYHLNEYFSFGLTGLFGGTSPTGSTSVCPAGQSCQPATSQQLNQVPGDIKWITGAELAFSPVYGKLNLFAEKAVHFDLSILGGADLVGYRNVVKSGQSGTPGTATSAGGHVGVGARIFLARFMALRVEVKDVIYSVPSLSTSQLQTQLFLDAGLSFFVPVTHRGD
ncbi:MAG TPA: outer membrane beta-barrel domain-containing protein [Anaeromyxobacteraceae bacterium]|nr:outer membrane beta-barrel domain-containing protein [Anaeromyxobacteraceae bacterium]